MKPASPTWSQSKSPIWITKGDWELYQRPTWRVSHPWLRDTIFAISLMTCRGLRCYQQMKMLSMKEQFQSLQGQCQFSSKGISKSSWACQSPWGFGNHVPRAIRGPSREMTNCNSRQFNKSSLKSFRTGQLLHAALVQRGGCMNSELSSSFNLQLEHWKVM